ncbi:MAG TPA: hypothetical protein VIK91_15100 [Nannocystis sp.]
MTYAYALLLLASQPPHDTSSNPSSPATVSPVLAPTPLPQPYTPPAPQPAPAIDPSLAAFLADQQQYAERLAQLMGKDLRAHWADYVEDELDKARERAAGDDDDDNAVQGFGAYLDRWHRRRCLPGIILFGTGFAPLGFGLYIGLTLGEAYQGGLALAGVGGALILTGGILWAVRGAQLVKFRRARDTLDIRGGGARFQWTGLTPIVDPRLRTGGLGLAFAF